MIIENLYGFIDKINYKGWLNDLRKSEFVKKLPLVGPALNNPLVDEYFDRKLSDDPKKDAQFEKKVAVALAKFASERLGLNRERSKALALKGVDFLRSARRYLKLAKGEITEKEYEGLRNASLMAKIWAKAKTLWTLNNGKIKDYVKTKGFAWLLKKAVKRVPIPVVQAVTKVWAVTPEPVRKLVKEGAKKVADWAVEKLPQVAEKLYEAGKVVVEKSARIIAKGVEIAKSLGKLTVEKTASSLYTGTKVVCTKLVQCVEKAKNIGKSIWNKVKSLF